MAANTAQQQRTGPRLIAVTAAAKVARGTGMSLPSLKHTSGVVRKVALKVVNSSWSSLVQTKVPSSLNEHGSCIPVRCSVSETERKKKPFAFA